MKCFFPTAVPLEDLGRPRVDVLANLSGIFRDSFANVVDVGREAVASALGFGGFLR